MCKTCAYTGNKSFFDLLRGILRFRVEALRRITHVVILQNAAGAIHLASESARADGS